MTIRVGTNGMGPWVKVVAAQAPVGGIAMFLWRFALMLAVCWMFALLLPARVGHAAVAAR